MDDFRQTSDPGGSEHRQLSPPTPIGGARDHFALKDGLAFLNHGSFGAVPRQVALEQEQWRQRIEADPVELLGRRCASLIGEAKQKIGAFLGMNADDFGLVTNATEGINAVLRSLSFKPGDELLTTNHVYNAIRQTMRYVTRVFSASYREIEIPLPVNRPEQILQAILSQLNSRTRLVVIDHVTSPTALIFLVRQIVAECARRGIDVVVDGAHAPGMLDLDVSAIGAAYYAGNLHKWVCAPRGSAFLHVRRDRQASIHPDTISHNLDQGFAREFDWQGTRDISAHLSAPRAISFFAELGWPAVRRHNHDLATWAHEMLCRRWGVEPISPLDGSLLGSMATVRLPGRLSALTEQSERELQQRLHDEFQIEAPVIRWCDQAFIRVSCQIYNRPDEYECLADVIERLAR